MQLFKCEILRNPTDDSEYIRRYVLIDCKYFGVYLQHFIAPDWSRDPHDHPRRFISIGLSGGYTEEIFYMMSRTLNGKYIDTVVYPYHTLDRQAPFINNIPAERIHRISKLRAGEDTWTLCLVGPRWRRWGFCTKNGYVSAKEYLGEDKWS